MTMTVNEIIEKVFVDPNGYGNNAWEKILSKEVKRLREQRKLLRYALWESNGPGRIPTGPLPRGIIDILNEINAEEQKAEKQRKEEEIFPYATAESKVLVAEIKRLRDKLLISSGKGEEIDRLCEVVMEKNKEIKLLREQCKLKDENRKEIGNDMIAMCREYFN